MNPEFVHFPAAIETPAFLSGGGEMGERMRAFDWSQTTLGPAAGWPQALRTSIRLMLSSDHPIFVFWGDEHICFYNDAFRPSVGPEKHPAMLGARGRDVWDEIWPVIAPQIDQVMAGHGATWHEDHLVPILRNGRIEDVYWTYSYNPIDHDGGIGGVLVLTQETTRRVLAEQRNRTERDRLRDLLQQSPSFVVILGGPEHRFEFVNDAYRSLIAGSRDLIGRTVAEVFPEVAGQGFPKLLDDVYRTGVSYVGRETRLVIAAFGDEPEREYFLDFIYKALRGADGEINGIFVDGYDVSDRVRAVQLIAASESRLRFLDRLSAATQPLGEAAAIVATAARLLGEHLGADICAYADTEPAHDTDTFTVRGEWTAPGVASIAGTYRLNAFGADAARTLRSGRPLVLRDTLAEVGSDVVATFTGLGLRATVCVPMIRDQLVTAVMAVHSTKPRDWTEAEVSLISETVERVWAHSERGRSAAAVHASEARFRAAIEAMQGVLWTNDAAGRMVGEQPGWAALTGQQQADYEGYGWSDAVHPGDAQPTVDAWNAAVAARDVFVFEHRVRRHDGQWRLFSVRAVPLMDDSGAVAEWVGVHTDITDKRLAFAALRDSEARFRNLADAMPQLVWTAGADGEIDYCNQRFRDFFGVGLNERFDWPKLVHPDDLPRSVAAWRLAVETGAPYNCEQRLRNADGRWVWHVSRAAAVTGASGAPATWYGTATDIEAAIKARDVLTLNQTELETAVAERTAALHEREARIRTIFETTHLFQGLLSPAGDILDANAAALIAIGHPLAVVRGKPFWAAPWFAATPGMPDTVRMMIARVGTGEPVQQHIVVKLPSGKRSFDMSLRPVRNDRGDVTAIVLDAFETTSRIAAEDALRQAQKMEAIGQLTGGVAHDFNNLLMVIGSGLRMLDRPGDPALSERIKDGMRQAVDRGTGLTRQLLAFSRHRPLESRPFDVAQQIIGMSELLERSLGGTVHLKIDLPDAPAVVELDPGEFELAIINLCVNARDAMPDGGTITVAARVINADTGRVLGDVVTVTVSDSGSGMDAETLTRVFEPFFTTKDVGKGSGLGLAQVYGFAVHSAGDVAIASEPGRGTVVTLTFPRSPQQVNDSVGSVVDRADEGVVTGDETAVDIHRGGGTGPAGADAVKPHRVLLVEDDVGVAAVTTAMLQDLGYRVMHASSAAAALDALAAANTPDLVFSDVMMPGGMNGIALAREIRATRPALPVILATGYIGGARDAQTDGFVLLEKPYELEELAATLSTALRALPD